jgi:hypothetical protein
MPNKKKKRRRMRRRKIHTVYKREWGGFGGWGLNLKIHNFCIFRFHP